MFFILTQVYEVKFGDEYELRINFSRRNGIRQIFDENEYLIALEEVNGRSTDVYTIVEYSQTMCKTAALLTFLLRTYNVCVSGNEDSANDICHGYQSGPDPAFTRIHDGGRVLLNSTALHIKFSVNPACIFSIRSVFDSLLREVRCKIRRSPVRVMCDVMSGLSSVGSSRSLLG